MYPLRVCYIELMIWWMCEENNRSNSSRFHYCRVDRFVRNAFAMSLYLNFFFIYLGACILNKNSLHRFHFHTYTQTPPPRRASGHIRFGFVKVPAKINRIIGREYFFFFKWMKNVEVALVIISVALIRVAMRMRGKKKPACKNKY